MIRVVPRRRRRRRSADRVDLFAKALARQREREAGRVYLEVQDRGWTREALYDRGLAR